MFSILHLQCALFMTDSIGSTSNIKILDTKQVETKPKIKEITIKELDSDDIQIDESEPSSSEKEQLKQTAQLLDNLQILNKGGYLTGDDKKWLNSALKAVKNGEDLTDFDVTYLGKIIEKLSGELVGIKGKQLSGLEKVTKQTFLGIETEFEKGPKALLKLTTKLSDELSDAHKALDKTLKLPEANKSDILKKEKLLLEIRSRIELLNDKMQHVVSKLPVETRLELATTRDIHVLGNLAFDSNDTVRDAVKKNRECAKLPENILLSLCEGGSKKDARIVFAGYPGLPKSVLIKLADDPSMDVLMVLVKRKDVPLQALKLMAGRFDSENYKEVLKQVVRHPNTDQKTLEGLLKSGKLEGEEYLFVSHRNMSPKILLDFADSKNGNVVFKGVNGPIGLHKAMAEVEHMSPEVLALLAKSKDQQVRLLVALNPNTPAKVLEKLALNPDEDVEVRKSALGNKNIPEKLLKVVANNSDEKNEIRTEAKMALDVRYMNQYLMDFMNERDKIDMKVFNQVVSNPDTDQPQLKFAVKSRKKAVLETFVQEGNSDLHKLMAKVADKDGKWASILASLAQSKDPEVRLLVAGNLSTPQDVLEKLAKDLDKSVQEQAQQTLDLFDSE